MTIDWWTLGLQTVNAVILVWILARFLFRPVSRILAERQAAARAALDEAEAARDTAIAARDAARAEARAVADRRAELMAAAVDAADQEKRRLIDEARAAADKARAEGQVELDRMRADQARALTEQAGALAADIAGRLLARLPEGARSEPFVDGLVDALAELPTSTRVDIGADGPVTIRAASDLSTEARDRLQARLADVLGHAPDLVVEARPELLAGLEIAAPHAVVRNSFRADLERIREGLSLHE